MPEPLKNHFGNTMPSRIAEMILGVHANFNKRGFVRAALKGYDALALMPRGWQIARCLREFLPANYPTAIQVLIQSLGAKLDKTENNGMAPFLYMPHVFFVAEFGLEYFEESMQAQYELTQRFTAEFSIRPYLQQHTQATLKRLEQWSQDDNVHVRRLVSEGTRPRLPWAPRLREFQRNPKPVLKLLELLKDDPELYVRRSVANNLNDIGKDHPDILFTTAQRWMKNASNERRWIVKYALRSAIKRGEPGALAVLGFADKTDVAIRHARITPPRPTIGDKIKISFDVINTGKQNQNLLVDFCIDYVKANGKTSAKVFKLKTVTLAFGESVHFEKTVSLADMTTRKHYAGKHKVDAMVNGKKLVLGQFELK